MKKNIVLLGILAIMFCVLPIKVSAASSFVDPDGDGVYENSADISAGMFGTFKAGDVTWEYESDNDKTDGIKTWNFYITVGSVEWEYIYMLLIPKNVEIESINPGSNILLPVDKNDTDTGSEIMYQSSKKLVSGERIHLFTVVTKDTSDDDCRLDVNPLNLDCTVNIDGVYFDNDGNVITEDEYNQVCGNVNPDDPNDEPVPPTGSVVPYVAIGGGLLAVGILYLFSRKSNKVYKI